MTEEYPEPKTMRDMIEATKRLDPPGQVINLGSAAVPLMLYTLAPLIDQLDPRDAILVLSIMLGERLFWLADSHEQSDFEKENNVIITPEEHKELMNVYIDKAYAGCVEASKHPDMPKPDRSKGVM